MLLFASRFCCVATALLLLSTAAYALTPEDLAGYQKPTSRDAERFVTYLTQTPQLLKELAARPEASQRIFANTVLQKQLMLGQPLAKVIPVQAAPIAAPEHATAILARAETKTQASTAKAQALIESAVALNKAAQEDPELQKLILSGELEGELAREEEPLTDVVDEAVINNEPFAVTNVNAIPAAESTAPDANGWPQYLHAPAHCQPPLPSLSYIHEPLYKADSGAQDTQIQHYWNGKPGFYLSLKHDEVISVPFIFTPKDGYGIHLERWGYHVSDAYVVASISSCPGDFGHAQEDWRASNLGKNCTVDLNNLATGSALNFKEKTSTGCQGEVGKRYFLNVQLVGKEDLYNNPTWLDDAQLNAILAEGYDEKNARRIVISDKLKAAGYSCPYFQSGYGWTCYTADNSKRITPPATLKAAIPEPCRDARCDAGQYSIDDATASKRMHVLPYNGPCLQNGPYPINYNSNTCGRSFGGNLCIADGSVSATCHDPQGEVASVRLVKSCRTGERPIWLEGYNEPLHSRMQCDIDVTPEQGGYEGFTGSNSMMKQKAYRNFHFMEHLLAVQSPPASGTLPDVGPPKPPGH